MRFLVVLSAVVSAALARPAYLGAAGIAGLQGDGIGTGAPANTAPGIAAPEIIAVGARYHGGVGSGIGSGVGAGHGSEHTVSMYCYGTANIQIKPDGAPAVNRVVVKTAKEARARLEAQTQAAQADADAAAGVYSGFGAGVGARYHGGVGSGIGSGIRGGHGSEHTAAAGMFCYGPSKIQIGPAGVVDTPL